jgi:hypothetical protein
MRARRTRPLQKCWATRASHAGSIRCGGEGRGPWKCAGIVNQMLRGYPITSIVTLACNAGGFLADRRYRFEKSGGNFCRWMADDRRFRISRSGSEEEGLATGRESGPDLASQPCRPDLRGKRREPSALAARGGRGSLFAPVLWCGGGGGLPTPSQPRTPDAGGFSRTWSSQG